MRLFHLTWRIVSLITLGLGVDAALTEAQQRPTPPATEALAAVPGVRLWYTDTGGSGVPVVLMHAATGSSRTWEYQTPALSKAGYRVIAYDRRGRGRSEIDASGPQPGTAADDLLALMDHLSISRFHLVGTAAGGIASVDFMLSFPRRLLSVVIASSIGGIQDEDYLELGRTLRPSEFAAMPPQLREVGPSYRAGNPEGTRRWIELEHVSRPAGPAAAAQRMRNRITLASLEGVTVPVLFIAGGADMFAPPPVMRMMAERIKKSEFVVMPDVGHSTYWEQPEVFNRAVIAFLKKH